MVMERCYDAMLKNAMAMERCYDAMLKNEMAMERCYDATMRCSKKLCGDGAMLRCDAQKHRSVTIASGPQRDGPFRSLWSQMHNWCQSKKNLARN